MRTRGMVALVAATALLAGCTGGGRPERAERAAAEQVVTTPLEAGLPPVPQQESVTTELALGEAIEDIAASLTVGARQAQLGDVDAVRVTSRNNSATIAVAQSSAGKVLATAVVAKVEGLEAPPQRVDFRSTAFTQLVSSPPFLTSNPIALALIRSAAEESQHLEALADLFEAHAAEDENYLADPTREEVEAYLALAEEVTLRLQDYADDVAEVGGDEPQSLESFTTERGEVLEFAPAAASTAQCKGGVAGIAGVDNGVCVTLAKQQPSAGVTKLEVVNNSPSWGVVYAGGDFTNPVATLQPLTFGLPSVTTIVTTLAKAGVSAEAKAATKAFCGVLGVGGMLKCPEDTLKAIDPVKMITGLYTDIGREGTSDFSLTPAQAQQPFYVVTGSGARGAASAPEVVKRAAADLSNRGRLLALGLTSHVLIPGLELMLDRKLIRNGTAPSKDAVDAMWAVLRDFYKDGTVVSALNQANSGDTAAYTAATLKAVTSLLSNGDIIAATLAYTGTSIDAATILKALRNWMVKIGVSAVPGVGWIYGAIKYGDLFINTVNVGMGIILMSGEANRYAPYNAYAALSAPPSPPPVLTDRSVVVCTYSGCDEGAVRPDQIGFTSGHVLGKLKWSAWTAKRAVATGVYAVRLYSEEQSGGDQVWAEHKVRVELGSPKKGATGAFAGKTLYLEALITYIDGAAAPQTQPLPLPLDEQMDMEGAALEGDLSAEEEEAEMLHHCGEYADEDPEWKRDCDARFGEGNYAIY